MTPALRALVPGPSSTVQDAGRVGWQRFGVSVAGAMDTVSLAVANALVGNPAGEAAVEVTLGPAVFAAEGGPVRVALAGGDFPLEIDGAPAEALRSHRLEPGQVLRIGPARSGMRAYLAVAGGLAVEPVMGSRSVHARSGLSGQPLAAGDALPLRAAAGDGPALAVPPGLRPPVSDVVRVVMGPQDDHFTPEAVALFLGAEYEVTGRSDRMGYRLSGPRLEHARGADIVSDAIAPGSIQVPGSGEPILLMADRQTTGGYPKIATAIGADLPRLAQCRPGERLRFRAVTVEAAHAARAMLADWLRDLPGRLVPVLGSLDSARLLSLDLVGGVTDGQVYRW